jgi:hypothetical protein
MRLYRFVPIAILPLALVAACDELTGLNADPDAPANVTYVLLPSGDPNAPAGVILSWDVPRSGRANAFNVYGRQSAGAGWQLRATTTSPTFHDAGVPNAQYYVATRDANGDEIAQSNVVTIDVAAGRLPTPQGLTSVSLNGAIQLIWSGNAVSASPSTFDHYLVYSTAYDATRGVCTANWVREGSTASDGFFAGNLTNGVSRCFAVSAVTLDGHESGWSASRLDTPRLDARNALVYATAVRGDSSSFVFFEDATKRTGVVGPATRTDADITVAQRSDGTLWFTPARSDVTVTLYSTKPITDLTSIDRAPSTGFGSGAIQAAPGFGYVFRIMKSDGAHYAGVRVAYVAQGYVVFDWSYQSGPGNPELNRIPSVSTLESPQF